MSESYKNATEFDRERGRRITRAREHAGLTRKQLASQLGIALSTLAGYETGGSDPKSDGLYKIAKVCNCSVDYLLGLTEYVQSSADLAKDALYHSDSLSSRAYELGERYDRMRGSEQSLCMAFVYMLSTLSEASAADDPGNLCFINTSTGNDAPMTVTSVESYLKACVNSVQAGKDEENTGNRSRGSSEKQA